MKVLNKINVKFPSISTNEGLARTIIAAFVLPLNPTLQELADIKTAVSEAVTNAIIHGYRNQLGEVDLEAVLYDDHHVMITIIDRGKGIDNITEAMAPLFTTAPELERSGMGFTIMEQFMDQLTVDSTPDQGTKVTMHKWFNLEKE